MIIAHPAEVTCHVVHPAGPLQPDWTP
jgi:hypothetical protein